jgi:hypothetical protein
VSEDGSALRYKTDPLGGSLDIRIRKIFQIFQFGSKLYKLPNPNLSYLIVFVDIHNDIICMNFVLNASSDSISCMRLKKQPIMRSKNKKKTIIFVTSECITKQDGILTSDLINCFMRRDINFSVYSNVSLNSNL